MRIAVDAVCMEVPEPTGVELAAAELMDAVPDEMGPDDRMIVLGAALDPFGHSDRGVTFHALGGPSKKALWRETTLVAGLRSHRADVLWSPVTAIPHRTRVPCVATVHELPWRVRPGLEGVLRENLHKVRLRQAVAHAARIVCPSESTRRHLLEEHPEAEGIVRVVPHGVRTEWVLDAPALAAVKRARGRAGAPEGAYFLHVGGARPRKDLPLLFAAFERYRERGGRVGLALIGPGPAPENLPDGAEFLGYVADEFLLPTYDGACAVVVSSESEGFALPVVEAFARGRPVVAVAQDAVEETAGGAALIVPRGDADALATALTRIATDMELRRELAAKGSARAHELSWSRAAAGLLEVLREAAAGA